MLTTKTVIDTREYIFSIGPEDTDDGHKNEIKITFKNGEFCGCHFNFKGTYSRNDWKVLKLIAEKIEELEKNHKKGN